METTQSSLEAQVAKLNGDVSSLQTQLEEAKAKQASGNATAENVLKGKTFSNSTNVNVTGTMVDRGAQNKTLNPGEIYTIPQGYHNGLGKVSMTNLVCQEEISLSSFVVNQPKEYEVSFTNSSNLKDFYLFIIGNDGVTCESVSFESDDGEAYLIMKNGNGNSQLYRIQTNDPGQIYTLNLWVERLSELKNNLEFSAYVIEVMPLQ